MTPTLRNALVIALAMLAASGGAVALRPTVHIADLGPKLDLDQIIPRRFGAWQEAVTQSMQVVNPQQREFLKRLYAQTLTRNYVAADGYQIMLSIAYGSDQSDSMQVHKPEICYPAQGFLLWSQQPGEIATRFGTIPIKRLVTSLNQRHEPVTYWITTGDRVTRAGLQQKLAQLSFGLNGKIPDGLLFRVSSIDSDTTGAYGRQDVFVKQLLDTLPDESRARLIGKPQ